MIKEITTFILNRMSHPYWSRDVNAFAGQIPIFNVNGAKVSDIDRVVGFLENAAPDVIGQLPDRQDKPLQIWNRHKYYMRARDDAMEFFYLLHGLTQLDLPIIVSGITYTAMIIDAIAAPAPILDRDEKARFVFSCNYIWRIMTP